MNRLAIVECDKLDRALESGRGAIVFSCHMGPYLLVPALLSLAGYRTVVVEKLGLVEGALVARQVRRLNRSLTRTMLETEMAYDDLLLKKLVRHLRDGKLVFMMGDYHGDRLTSKARRVRFMGHEIVPGRAIAWLHAKTAAPIFPVMERRAQGGRYFGVLDQLELDIPQKVDYNTQAVYCTIEQEILRSPEKWLLWMDYHLMLSKKQVNQELPSGTVAARRKGVEASLHPPQ